MFWVVCWLNIIIYRLLFIKKIFSLNVIKIMNIWSIIDMMNLKNHSDCCMRFTSVAAKSLSGSDRLQCLTAGPKLDSISWKKLFKSKTILLGERCTFWKWIDDGLWYYQLAHWINSTSNGFVHPFSILFISPQYLSAPAELSSTAVARALVLSLPVMAKDVNFIPLYSNWIYIHYLAR